MFKNKKNKKISSKREKQTRYLSQAIQLEEAVNPHIIRATMTMISLAILVFLGWASITNINEVARTPGEVVPDGHQQTVQHLEGGIVKAIHVREGSVVDKNQPLVTLDDASIKKDIERARVMQLNLEMQGERLRAFLDDRDPDFVRFTSASKDMVDDQNNFFNGMRDARLKEQEIIRVQQAEKRQSIRSLQSEIKTIQTDLKISKDIYERRKKLNDKGYTSDMKLLEDERQVNQIRGELSRLRHQVKVAKSTIQEYSDRLDSLTARHRDEVLERLSTIVTEKAQNNEIIQKLEERIRRLEIRSPAYGLVKGTTVNTVGAILQPGQTIMEVVPLDKDLEVSVKISPQDIGHIEIGQAVQVKFSTFDFSRYGFVSGKLEQISATTFNGDNGDRYYQGRILLEQNYVGSNRDNTILPGMTVMADVITGRKTILEYMLKPIHISLKTAFTER